ncbi:MULTISPECIES: Fur family transcriptional regulator [Streptomyces]|uniref:Fur family transcriptional regulator n=1 Tax=Streptomyces fradiae TaxID=1906 RepID=A0ACC4W9G7_STRFR|nr:MULTISPECIES: transcriptional repressor [Streptomyces]KNE81037.1 Fur family transcriptional regulator [Streptomyces fradiae]OFA49684.1 transcriptional repressor [Streptomyces fradiae]
MVTTDWQSDLRKRGYRLTPQRQLVLEAVDKLEHATPDEILTEVRRTAGGVNISTVYRTLELLEELGLVSHAHLGHGAPTYHLADRHHHLHLVCRDCSEVIEADLSVADAFTARLRETFGFETDMKHFAIFGRCAACSAGTPGADGDTAAGTSGPAAVTTAPDTPGGTTARASRHRGADGPGAGP